MVDTYETFYCFITKIKRTCVYSLTDRSSYLIIPGEPYS